MTHFSADMQKFLQIRQNPQNPKNHKMESRDRMKLANFKKKLKMAELTSKLLLNSQNSILKSYL